MTMPSAPSGASAGTTAQANGSGEKLRFHQFGMAMRFRVAVDALDLGHWNSCEGLKVEFKTEAVGNGGHYDHQAWLPQNVLYGAVTLKRAMIKSESAKVEEWLKKVAKQWTTYMDTRGEGYQGGTATITLLDVCGDDVHTWTLRNVRPSSWSGPSLNADQTKVAIETLVIEHEGFL